MSSLPSPRIKLPIASIDASNRIRKDYSHVSTLAESIAAHGLLQPLVVTADNRLVAGGSRLEACKSLGWTDVDVVFIETIPEDRLRILEVEENIRRKDFHWSERVLAVARIHALKRRDSILNPESETWMQRQTGELLGVSVGYVNYCLALAKHIEAGDKEILDCENVAAAWRILLERKETEANRALALATLKLPPTSLAGVNVSCPVALPDVDIFSVAPPQTGGVEFVPGSGIRSTLPAFLPGSAASTSPTVPVASGSDVSAPDSALAAGADAGASGAVAPIDQAITHKVREVCLLGDCLSHLPTLKGKIHHVITDIPYGIDMGNLSQQNTGMDVSSVAAEHDVESNIKLMDQLLPAVYDTLPDAGFFILWYDLDHHDRLASLARTVGFKVQRWPLVWVKTAPCLNQAAAYNFTKSTEFAMVLRKGNATLVQPQPNNFYIGGRESDPRLSTHPFAKPLTLWKWIMNAVAIKGQTIYDPFAGVGSSTLACLEAGFNPVASELNPNHHANLVENVHNFYTSCLTKK